MDVFLAENIVYFIIAFLATVVCGPIFIPMLTRLKFGQTVRDDGPSSHLKKTGTPTMGGVIFMVPVVVLSMVLVFDYPDIFPLVFATVGFGAIGFIDDYLKIKKKSKDGLFAKQKMLGLLIVAVIFTLYISFATDLKNDFGISFLGFDLTFGFRLIFILYSIFIFASTTNAVNMTDGLDGLASGVTLVVMMFFSIFAVIKGDIEHVNYFSSIVAGGCLGFIVFNMYPAKVFMGDTGSLALGGVVGALVLMVKLPPVVVLFICIIYVAETLSVIIQVTSYKKWKKRVFKMAPLHHHFELSGWSEIKVVSVFWLTTVSFCIIGGLAYYFGIY